MARRKGRKRGGTTIDTPYSAAMAGHGGSRTGKMGRGKKRGGKKRR